MMSLRLRAIKDEDSLAPCLGKIIQVVKIKC